MPSSLGRAGQGRGSWVRRSFGKEPVIQKCGRNLVTIRNRDARGEIDLAPSADGSDDFIDYGAGSFLA